MKEKFIKIVRKSGTSLVTSIPPEILKLLRISEGDVVRIEIEKVK